MKRYEIVFIVRPNLEEETIKKVVEDFHKLLETNKAKVILNKELGKKTLAYEIKKFESGYYFLFQVEADDHKAISEFDRLARINDNIIRHLIIRIDE
jgi:small subunit ribosomal protein S6